MKVTNNILNTKEINFLSLHGLSSDDVYDGRNETRASYRINAKQMGKTVILGNTCNAAGHRLKTRAGHCVQCDPAKLAYEKRHYNSGFVYLAESKQAGLIKVGVTQNIKTRNDSLNSTMYAGEIDWRIIHSENVQDSGKIEKNIQRKLKRYSVSGRLYEKNGKMQEATEVFKTQRAIAIDAFNESLEIKLNPIKSKKEKLSKFSTPKSELEIKSTHPSGKSSSPLYWSNDGGDDKFLGESKSPIHFVIQIGVMFIIIMIVLNTCVLVSM